MSSALLMRVIQHAHERPASMAYRAGEDGALSYRELFDAAMALAGRLRPQLPSAGTVILSSANRAEFAIAFLGILAAGGNVFPFSAEAADPELLRAAKESGAVGVIGDARAIDVLGPAVPVAIPIEDIRGAGNGVIEPRTGELLLQSSGTTGMPKIVRRSAQSMDAVAKAMADSIGFRSDDRVLMTIPLSHSYGLEHGLLAPLWAGSCVHLHRGLNLGLVEQELAEGGITIFPGVPSTFEMLCGSVIARLTLRIAYSAGAPLPGAVFEAFLDKFKIPVTQLYGATEIGSVAFNPANAPLESASVGRAMENVSIRILDLEDGATELPIDEEGQVAVRAASMLSRYMNESPALIDGHFPTGDLGHLDATGRLFISGRVKLLIDVGGMKVNPLEVEAVLQQHPAVAACVVVPVKQSHTVYRLKAIVTLRNPDEPVSVEELRKLARAQLAPYKVPRVFELRDSLPRSATGKILRHLVETA